MKSEVIVEGRGRSAQRRAACSPSEPALTRLGEDDLVDHNVATVDLKLRELLCKDKTYQVPGSAA